MSRFRREAQTLAKLQHPNIVRFYGIERDGRLAFMLLDYIEGESLKPKIFDAEGPYPLDGVRTVMRAICGALAFAHGNSLIHCDIKPANIMLEKHGRVLLSDFGIARMSDAATATMEGMGTPAYMAPEQARGLDPIPQTDIYALGIVLFEMLTGGWRPFTGEHAQTTGGTSEMVRWEQINLAPPSPKRWNPDISDELEAVLLKCLAKEPVERYDNPLDLMNALELALPADVADEPDESVRPRVGTVQTSAEVAEEMPRRRGLLPVLVVIGIIAVVVGAGLLGLSRGDKGPLSMMSLAIDTPTVTASPLPTETSEVTALLVPTETALNSPSAIFIITQTKNASPIPSQTPTNTSTIFPTDTPTLINTIKPPTNTPKPTTSNPQTTPTIANLFAQISSELIEVNLRKSPGYVSKNDAIDVVVKIPGGALLEILDGPSSADNLEWWRVSWNGYEGWIAEKTGSGRMILFFEP